MQTFCSPSDPLFFMHHHNFDVFAIASVWLNQILIQVNKPNYMSPLLVTEQAGRIGWSESGGLFFKEVELPKAGGLGAASGVQGLRPGGGGGAGGEAP